MNEKKIRSSKLMPAVLVIISLALAAVTSAKVYLFSKAAAGMEKKINAAITAANNNSEEKEKYLVKFTGAADTLKKDSIFKPPVSKSENPVKSVHAIMGSEVLINNKWYKAGDSIGQAKLVKIDPAQVFVEWEGETKTYSPISAPTTYAVNKKDGPSNYRRPDRRRKDESEPKDRHDAESVAKESTQEDFGWIGVKLSPRLMAKFSERWSKMSEKERAEAKERWSAMSDQQKQMFVGHMERNVDNL